MLTTISIAGLTVGIEHAHEHIAKQCRAYLSDGTPDFTICVTHEMIEAERAGATGAEFSLGYSESIAAYREIARRLPEYDALLFHSAVIELDGAAYAFAASSGTGKSTHIRLWRRVYGERVGIVNGDKPILRFREDGVLIAYGTPWCGKEGWQRNVGVPLAALVFLERGAVDAIAPMEPEDAVMRFLSQTVIGKSEEDVAGTLEMSDRILASVDTYLLKCTPNESAARVAYATLVGGCTGDADKTEKGECS